MRHWMLGAALLWSACDKEEEETSTSAESDTDTDADADTDTDTDTDADADTDTDPNQWSVPVADARYECGGLDTGATSALSVEAGTASGTASVGHTGIQTGCCPTLDITAVADTKASAIALSYDLSQDDCDCVCTIDLYYTLTDLPAGAWTVTARGDTATVTIP